MKRLLFVFAMIFAMGTSTYAQQNVIKANLFSVIIKTGSFFYERALDDTKSLQLGFYYTGFSVGDTKFRGFGITPEFRFYPGEEAPSGFYLAPFLRYQSLSLSADYYDDVTGQLEEGSATLSTFGGGLLIGNQWLFGDVVALDMFIGPAYNTGSLKVKDGNESNFEIGGFSGFGVRFGLTIGVAF